MSSWSSLLIPVFVAALTIAVNAVVNIKIKFAPDAKTAAQDIKIFALRVFEWIMNAGLVFVLGIELFSSEPLTRLEVFKIALYVSVITLLIVFHIFNRLVSQFKLLIDLQTRIVESIKDKTVE